MSTHDKIAIVHRVIVDLQGYDTVATQFRVKKRLVCSLVLRARKHPQFLSELIAKDECRVKLRSRIAAMATFLLDTGVAITSQEIVQAKLSKECDLQVSPYFIRKVLHEDLLLRYNKIKRVPFQGNSYRCLIQR